MTGIYESVSAFLELPVPMWVLAIVALFLLILMLWLDHDLESHIMQLEDRMRRDRK